MPKKIWKIHDYISQSFYINHPNLKAGQKYGIDLIIFIIGNGILNKNMLITGNYGLGKTTTAQAVSSLLFSLPLEVIRESVIYGHPHLTEEKIVGRLDFSRLNLEEKVIFSLTSQIPSIKIIDEINRIPEGTQNMLLNSVESGDFIYLNDSISGEKYPFVATANYKDEGNNDIMPPLLDRFDISIEVIYPIFITEALGNSIAITNKKRLSNRELSARIKNLLLNKDKLYSKKIEGIKHLKEEFSQKNREIIFNDDEREEIKSRILSLEFSEDANNLLHSFFDYLNSVLQIKGSQRSNHNQDQLFSKITNNYSVRSILNSAIFFSKYFSFISEEDKVSTKSVLTVLPYILSHRTTFRETPSSEDDYSSNSSHFTGVKKLVNDYYNKIFIKHIDLIRDLYLSIKSGDPIKFIEKYEGSDHPLYKRAEKIFNGL
ncbi:MAG: hypothetical protein CR982_06585 [Candidatus Cloacimonadota bacterium]|nr:MAG: hypothetical protein CR982_06585 [Candidatus Cloacimonadota bacterium]PIE79956.1 MAG: hypothetical protein CSA15_02505 [Candidatus Delongbacteria bacterium]